MKNTARNAVDIKSTVVWTSVT